MARQKFLTRKPKQESPSWKKRNDARQQLQEQHARRVTEHVADEEPSTGDLQRIADSR